MKPVDCFGVFVRSLGAVLIPYGARDLAYAFAARMELSAERTDDMAYYASSGLCLGTLGILLLLNARAIALASYPAGKSDSEPL